MFAVLHIADFALHAVLRTEPGHGDRPAALFATRQKKSVVLAATPAARALGIEPGMTAPQAVARHPDLLIRTPCATAEAEARAALLAVGFTLSPTIEDTAPGICTTDLKGFFPVSPEPSRDNVINGGARCGARRSLARRLGPHRAASGSVGAKPDEDIGFDPSEPVRSMEKQTSPECTRLIRTAAAAIAELAQLGLPATAGLARTPLLALYAAKAASSPDSFTPTATRGPQSVGSGESWNRSSVI